MKENEHWKSQSNGLGGHFDEACHMALAGEAGEWDLGFFEHMD